MDAIKNAYIQELARRIIDCLGECRIFLFLVWFIVVAICYTLPEERVFLNNCCHSFDRVCIEQCPNKYFFF